jgi:hypothetical protein
MSARDPSLSFVCEMIALYGPLAFRAEAARLYLVPAGGEDIEVLGDDVEVLSLLAYWYKSTCLLVQTYFRCFEQESWSDTYGHSRGARANQQGRGAPQAQHAVHAGSHDRHALLNAIPTVTNTSWKRRGAVDKCGRRNVRKRLRYSVYVLDWYKSTITDAAQMQTRRGHTLGGLGAKKFVERPQIQKGIQLPCFTGTKVQILSQGKSGGH